MRHVGADVIVYHHGDAEPFPDILRVQNRCLPRCAVVEHEMSEHDAYVALIVLHAKPFR